MPLLDLPPEILHLACTYCDAGDVQSLRLTCRTVQSIADEHLLETIYGCFEVGSLQKIAEISRGDSKILKGVTSLVLQAGLLQELNFTQWREKAQEMSRWTKGDVSHNLNRYDRSSTSTAWQESTKGSLIHFRACLQDVEDEDDSSTAKFLYDHYIKYRRLCRDRRLMEQESLIRNCVADLFKALPQADCNIFDRRCLRQVYRT